MNLYGVGEDREDFFRVFNCFAGVIYFISFSGKDIIFEFVGLVVLCVICFREVVF